MRTSVVARSAGLSQAVRNRQDDTGQTVADGVYVIVFRAGAGRQTQRVAMIR